MSHATWQQRFAADPDIVGRSVTLDGRLHTVLGVLPETFAFPERSTELWTPLVTEIPNQQPGQVMLIAFGGLARLRDGITLEEATVEGQTIVSRQHAVRPEPMAQMPAPTLRLIPLQEELVAGVRPALMALLTAVGCVLLIACANLASLLLAYGATRRRELAVLAALGVYGVLAESVAQRQREIGIRMALGADPPAIMRLILGQGALLVAIGVAGGLAASVAASRVVASLLFGVSRTDPVTYAIVPVVLASVALAACYLPARRATAVDPMTALRAE